MATKRQKKRETFTEQLQRAIAESGRTRYRIAQESGVSEAALSRFMSGKRGLSTLSIDALAEVLGLELVARTKKPKKKTTKRSDPNRKGR